MKTIQSELSRTATRLLIAADNAPRSLDDLQLRAGYSRNDGRPLYRQHAEALVRAGLFTTHAPYRTGRYPRYSRTAAGDTALERAVSARPTLRPLTPVDSTTGRPAPIAGDLSDPAARMLLALATLGSATIAEIVAAAGYAGDVTTWFRREFMTLVLSYYAVADTNEDQARALYTLTPAGQALADEVAAAMPPLVAAPSREQEAV